MAFVVSVAVSVASYQFVYIPQATATPVVPEEVLNPAESVEILYQLGLHSHHRPKTLSRRR